MESKNYEYGVFVWIGFLWFASLAITVYYLTKTTPITRWDVYMIAHYNSTSSVLIVFGFVLYAWNRISRWRGQSESEEREDSN